MWLVYPEYKFLKLCYIIIASHKYIFSLQHPAFILLLAILNLLYLLLKKAKVEIKLIVHQCFYIPNYQKQCFWCLEIFGIPYLKWLTMIVIKYTILQIKCKTTSIRSYRKLPKIFLMSCLSICHQLFFS